jgi:hypothetical protein
MRMRDVNKHEKYIFVLLHFGREVNDRVEVKGIPQ